MNISNPHPGDEQLAKYQAGGLSASEVLMVSDHLLGCPACRAWLAGRTFESTRRPVPGAELPSVSAADAPTYEEMAALLEGTLSDSQRAEVRARLETSPHAAAEFADLQRFRDESARLEPKIHGARPAEPGETADLPEDGPAAGKVVGFPGRRGRLFAAWAAAAVLLLSVGWWLTASRSPRSAGPALWAEADLSGLPADLHRDVERAATTGVVQTPPLSEELRPPGGALAGSVPAGTAFRQTSPVGAIVQEDRPTFRWTARDGASSYVVYLVDKQGRTLLRRDEMPGDRTDWTPSSPLARGTVYEWQVEARRGGEIIDRTPQPPAPETRFQVLDEANFAELTRLEARYSQHPLILGTAYARVGLSEAAVREFVALERQYPQSPIAKRLLETARASDEAMK